MAAQAPSGQPPEWPSPAQGDLWWVELGEPVPAGQFSGAVGHEQAGRRPALVVSTDAFNALPPRLCAVVPLTTRRRNLPLHVEITPADADVPQVSYVKCEDTRAVSQVRLRHRLGRVSPAVLRQVQQRLRLILGL